MLRLDFGRFCTDYHKRSCRPSCADNCDSVRICSLRGQSVSCIWASANARASSGAGKGSSPSDVSGSLAVSPGATITCTGAGGSASRTFRASVATSSRVLSPVWEPPCPELVGGQGRVRPTSDEHALRSGEPPTSGAQGVFTNNAWVRTLTPAALPKGRGVPACALLQV